ncbi:MAG: tol-pal system-associated acyl-CoA thioesterase [Thiobacillaceae bacterium]
MQNARKCHGVPLEVREDIVTQSGQPTAFRWPVRIYWEDTDAGGVVYYANYLKFMERARSEWLRVLGFDQNELRNELGIVFMVRRVTIEYLKPARYDDLLTISARLEQANRASFVMKQTIERDELLCRAEVTLVCVNAQSFKPVRIPNEMLQALKLIE